MNWGRGRNAAHAAAVAELREREDRAPRLCDELPRVASLRLHLSDAPVDGHGDIRGYVKPVQVPSAPAHFELHCLDPQCDGYHDLTDHIMDELRAEHANFAGTSPCHGFVGDTSCERTLAFRVEVAFEPRRPR